jgi:cytochrome c553
MKAKAAWILPALMLAVTCIPAAEYENPVPWSYKPMQRPALPEVKNAAWACDDLDRFILARLEKENLQPVGDASRAVWIRRASFDLRGLPPSQEEVEAFLRDPSADDAAFAKVVDAFLQSERFGERWARHWLDVVHYADSIGRVWNAPFLYAFRYRDWVIDSFNADKPYNRFIAEQIAGDLLPAKTVAQRREQITGTGMLALGSLSLQEGSYEQFILDQVDDQMDVTSRAFLGLTLSCARCHDHKTEPVSQKDYYALAGIFYSSRTLSGLANRHDMTRAGYVDPEMLVDLPTSLNESVGPPQMLPAGVHSMDDIRALGNPKQLPRYDTDPHFCMGVVEGEARDCELAVGGDPYERLAAPGRGKITVPGLPPLPPIAAASSGRLELAQWIAAPTHPLTARVMVNRVWQHLFGEGIVRTVDDFGSTGADPTHPELLDHLAIRFVEGGWSVKGLIRNLMLSRTYRLACSTGAAADPNHPDAGNRLRWRMNARRLEIEPMRDTLLQLAGRLDLVRPEGTQVGGTGGKGRLGITQSFLSVEDPFRTIYLPVVRDGVPELFSTFDFPGPTQIKGLRDVTTTAPQSLFFMNSPFMEDVAGEIAGRILEEKKNPEESVNELYSYLLGRKPSAEEQAEALTLLEGTESGGDPARWTTLVQALLGTAEFRYVF